MALRRILVPVIEIVSEIITHFLALALFLVLLADVACAHPLPDQVDNSPSAANNRVHEIMKAPMSYILLTPIVLVFLGSIPLSIIAWRHHQNPVVNAKILAAKSARIAQCAEILVDEAQGKADRKAERAKALAKETREARA